MAETVRVVFRRFRKGGDLIALFPDLPWDRQGNVTSYLRVGQHGPADWSIVGRQTTPADKDAPDVRQLAAELTGRGYDLKIVRKR